MTQPQARLPYHDNRDALRADLIDASTRYFPATGETGLNAPADIRIASVLGSSYAYHLAAAVQWIAQNVSSESSDEFASWLSDSLTNGDDLDLNADLIPDPNEGVDFGGCGAQTPQET